MPVRSLYHEMYEFHTFATSIRNAFKADSKKVFGMYLSENFDSLEGSRYFNTENGEFGMVMDLLEGCKWLESKLRERDEREARIAKERGIGK